MSVIDQKDGRLFEKDGGRFRNDGGRFLAAFHILAEILIRGLCLLHIRQL